MSDESKYDLEPIKAPRAAGTMLKMLTGLMESKVTGGMLVGKLLKDAGVVGMRAAVADDAHPLAPPMPGHRSSEPAPTMAAESLEKLPVPESGADFRFETVADFAEAYRTGRTTPEKLAQRILEICKETEALDPAMCIFIAQDEQDLLSQAQASSERFAQGKPLGLLDGVPVAVKDELDQKGYPTTVGTSFLGTKVQTEDAWSVAQLRKAGALLIGKANMHEIGLGVTGVNPHHGPARNPYNPAHVTGGSSSGPAAAVAMGLCPFSVGADGGGSIRIPGALCGGVGLKPTFGRVSEQGAAPLCWSVAHVGPIGASARDVAIGYGLMAGTDPHDPNSLGQPAPHLNGFGDSDLKGVRLGIYRPWFEDAQDEVVSACQTMLDHLVSAGAQLVDVEVPELALLRVVHMVTIVSEMSAAHLHHRANNKKRYGYDTRLNLHLASKLTAADYIHAQRLRQRICKHFYGLYEKVDAVVTPTAACVAPEVPPDALKTGESNLPVLEQIMRFAPAANLTGLPAISFPAGYSQSGLPIGFQAMGRPWDEALLLRLAQISESFLERKKPQVSYQLLAD